VDQTSPGRKYAHEIRFDDPTDVHALAVAATPVGSRVLDIGCADGSLASVMCNRGSSVVGVDVDLDALKLAGEVTTHTAQIDLDQEPSEQLRDLMSQPGIDGRRFDTIVALDVLEHLRSPQEALKALVAECLAPHGRVILSIPNVAHGSVRLMLLNGSFQYRNYGLLDRTHLRFFTRASVEELLAAAGLTSIVDFPSMRGYNETEIPVDLATVPAETLQTIESDPDSFIYQFFLVACRSDAPPAIRTELAAIIGKQVERDDPSASNVAAPLDSTEADQLRAQLDAITVEHHALSNDLTAVTRELHQNHLELQDAERSVAMLHAMERSETWRIGYAITQPLRILRPVVQRVVQRVVGGRGKQ
jgi:2-polyprenyl-3-methyl-5-hydroxy-6-metoxy-1,4-benzoquinol methylase